ncbi:MAG: DUF6338 family protein [bacterium]
MTINEFEIVFYTLAFIVPGFIFYSVIAAFIPQRVEVKEISFLRFLTFSCSNYAIWSWLVFLIFKSKYFLESPMRSAIAWGVIIFVSPISLGVLFGWLSQKEIIRNILSRIGLTTIHSIPTAWDYIFSKIKPVWILVTLKDNSQVAGFFGNGSMASSELSERDIFIRMVFHIDENGQWEKVEKTNGILIKGDQIKCIEFWEE